MWNPSAFRGPILRAAGCSFFHKVPQPLYEIRLSGFAQAGPDCLDKLQTVNRGNLAA